MREIKFRGKHQNRWFYGSLLKNIDDDKFYITVSMDQFYQVKEETIGQFTGLKDKNGVEIYEGDIVKLEYLGEDEERPIKVGVMNFKENQWCVNNKHLDGFTMNMYTREVIGNIYENKELLEK